MVGECQTHSKVTSTMERQKHVLYQRPQMYYIKCNVMCGLVPRPVKLTDMEESITSDCNVSSSFLKPVTAVLLHWKLNLISLISSSREQAANENL